jgi:pimeloyl-ACP methyl ester carboxylesterase
VPSHSVDVLEVHERMLGASAARGRHVELRSGRRVHVIEAGDGPPVVILHGSGTSSLSVLGVLEHVEGVRAIAVDRPGFGLSDPVRVPRERFRDAAVEFIDEIADALGLETFALAGNSMGGTWGLWYALARPERARRLVLLGSAPLLPGTRPPALLRMVTAPGVGDVLPRAVKPNAKRVVQMMSSMGEKDTIVRHPALIESLVAAGRDPVTSATNLAELRAVMTVIGFRRSMFVQPDELRRLTVPTLVLWGDHDPVGGVDVAEATARLVPEARLEVLPEGHALVLGDPERVADLLSGFVRSEGEERT